MNDLRDRLGHLAGSPTGPSAAEADADVVRGRRALQRRRLFQTSGASAAAVAALVAVVAVGATTQSGADPTPPRVVAAQLVAYEGKQPQGFTIDKVPSGWEVQGGDTGALTIAPKGIADQDASSFVGKIAIMLQSVDDHQQPSGPPLTVGGRPAVLADGSEPNVKNLWVKQPDGVWLQVQIWDASGWTRDQIVEFGNGIHVLPGAVRGRG